MANIHLVYNYLKLLKGSLMQNVKEYSLFPAKCFKRIVFSRLNEMRAACVSLEVNDKGGCCPNLFGQETVNTVY